MSLVIAGAFYLDEDTVLVPHYTGDFAAVDCHTYETEKDIRDKYSERYVRDFIHDGQSVTVQGETYYLTEWGPFHVTEDWELLSDLSELKFIEFETQF
jgi:hypothetical protein